MAGGGELGCGYSYSYSYGKSPAIGGSRSGFRPGSNCAVGHDRISCHSDCRSRSTRCFLLRLNKALSTPHAVLQVSAVLHMTWIQDVIRAVVEVLYVAFCYGEVFEDST